MAMTCSTRLSTSTEVGRAAFKGDGLHGTVGVYGDDAAQGGLSDVQLDRRPNKTAQRRESDCVVQLA